ncbi:tetratricopeptide repeat protein [Lentzea sp. NPDC042327]|uniref:tetratricopeptide repeat protein n=1 Tax=Lentzea sp. NPDC042327 TaxID=3154801 RepID=UPI0033D2660E
MTGDQHFVTGSGSVQINHPQGPVTVTGTPPAHRLEPFSFVPAVDPARLAHQPSRLLDARSQVVPFSGRDDELAALARWRDTAVAPMSALLVHGPGGQGKTRLAARFAEVSASAGWEVALARHASEAAWSGATFEPRSPGGLLVVVDYADRWPHLELVALLRELGQVGRPVRVLLVGRTVQWWPALRGELREIGADVGDLLLPDFADGTDDRERAFAAARDRFAAVLGVSAPVDEVARGLDGDEFGQVLTIHMAALVTALRARHPGGPVPDGVEGIAAYLLDRERMGWERLQPRPGFRTTSADMARAVFTSVLSDSMSHRDGLARLTRLRLEPAQQVLDDHRFCYPPHDRSRVLQPLQPDRLAEDFVALMLPGHDITGYDPDPWAGDVPGVLLGVDEPDAAVPSTVARTITVLASAAGRWPHVGRQLGALLGERPQVAVHADSAALIALAEARHVDTDVLLAVEVHLPDDRQVDLDEGAAAVTERLVRERVTDTARLQDVASWCSRLGTRLGHAGRKQEAVRYGLQALAALSRLEELDPRTYGVDVALCLMRVGAHLSDLGRHDTAVGFTGRAVELLRAKTEDSARAGLALALSNYGNQLQNVGQRGNAVAAAEESVALHRVLEGTAAADPPMFAFALTALGTRLMAVGEDEAALRALGESVERYRSLVDSAPKAHLPGLARALTNLGTACFRLGRSAEALEASAEAVDIRRDLVAVNREAYAPDLALSLMNHAGRLCDVGRDAEATATADEAVASARKLAQADPVRHTALLAATLSSRGSVYAQVDRDRAVDSLREAVALYERLVVNNESHRSMLDTALRNLRILDSTPAAGASRTPQPETVELFNRGVLLEKAGRTTEAEHCYLGAADAGLAEAMFNLGHLYRADGRPADAECWFTAAVTAGMTSACFNLGALCLQQGRRDEARRWFHAGADAGMAIAMTVLGSMYRDDGAPAEAERWFIAATERGEPEGHYRFGLTLAEQGRHAEAAVQLAKAAEAGHADAAKELADHQMRHNQTHQAHRWWRIARAGRAPAPPPPTAAPQSDHPLVQAALDRDIPTHVVSPAGSVSVAAELREAHVRQLLDAGRLDDAIDTYLGAARDAEALLAHSPTGSDLTYSLLRQRAVDLSRAAALQQTAGRTTEALAASQTAVTALGELAARSGDTATHARAQRIFAAIRADARTELDRAVVEVEEAIATFSQLGGADYAEGELRLCRIVLSALRSGPRN